MNVTATVRIDLGDLAELGTINTCWKPAYARWEFLTFTEPDRVVIDIGDAEIVWSPVLVEALSQVADVQIVGGWPEHVAVAAANLRALVARAAA